MKRAVLCLLALGSSILARADPPVPTDAARQEAKRRHDVLVQDGFNFTHGWHVAAAEKLPRRLDLIIPETGEHVLSLWLETFGGEGLVRLLGADGHPWMELAGRTGELTVTREVAAGKYVLEIDTSKSKGGEVLFGVKGSVLSPCEVDTARVKEVPAVVSSGFSWPYLLFVPQQVRSPHLLVIPNNTDFSTENLDFLRASVSCEVARNAALASRLGTAMLIPLFPRPSIATEEENLYLHALSRASLETTVAAWVRVDLQLLAMIRHARARLQAQGVKAGAKVLLSGFSASGSFVNRFAFLHPQEVQAVASGSPGGWPLAPTVVFGGEPLPYPVGIADLEQLVGRPWDLKAAKRVRWFFFLGDSDENDAVRYRDSFSKANEELIFRRFGSKPVARWKIAERLYAERGLNARFALYPGAGHEVTPAMRADVEKFLLDAQQGP
jgi:dienelactone hydrolase